MTTEQMHVIAKITDARTFERQLEQTVEEAAEFIQAAQKIKRYPGNSLQMNHLVEETGCSLPSKTQKSDTQNAKNRSDSSDLREPERFFLCNIIF